MIKDIISKHHVDVVHYLNPIGFKEPGYLWKLDVPYVWGPIQTVANRPLPLYPALSLRGKINAVTRFVVHNALLYFSPRVRKAMKHADAIFTAVPKAHQDIKAIFHRDNIYLPENGIIEMNRTEPIEYDGESDLRLIIIGSLIERKGVGILLNALRRVENRKWHLDVLGSGPLEGKLKSMAERYGLSHNISWLGNLPRFEVFEKLRAAHIHVISSLGEGNPTTLWEAMSLAVPTLTLDHCGMSAVVCEKCGIKIPIKAYEQVVNDMASQIEHFISNPERVASLSKGVIECAKKFMWDERIAIYDKVYEKLIGKHK